jgi:hypothetical protein
MSISFDPFVAAKCGRSLGYGVTGTVYSTSHSSGGSRPVSPRARGFGSGLPGARARPSRRSSAGIHSGAPSGRPIVGARSIRAVVAGSAGAVRSAAKSGINARKGATVASSSSAPARLGAGARPWPVLGTARKPRDHRIERDVTRCGQQVRLVHHHRTEAALEQMARPAAW